MPATWRAASAPLGMATRAPDKTGESTLAETVSPSLLLRVLAMPLVRMVIFVPAGIVTADPVAGAAGVATGGACGAGVAGGMVTPLAASCCAWGGLGGGAGAAAVCPAGRFGC